MMKLLTNGILCALLFCGVVRLSYAKDWRGLIPLRSTRADVVRMFGQCSDQKEACRFTLGDEEVYMLFSGGLASDYRECVTSLQPETLMFIEVEPRRKMKLSALNLDKQSLQYLNPSNRNDSRVKGYRSKDGLILSLFQGRILQVFYIANQSNRNSCASYYEHRERFVAVPIVHVPSIYSVNSSRSIKTGEILKVSADSSMNETQGYAWTLSAGRIVSGQYTKTIAVDTTGLAGKKIVIEAKIRDVFGMVVSGSCVVQVLPN